LVKLYNMTTLAIMNMEVRVMTQPAPKEIPASEVRGQISEVISRVAYGGERVVISRNGKAQVAVVPITDLDRLKQMDEQREGRRRRAAQAVADIQEASARSGDSKLTDEEIDAEIAEARRARRQRARK
jgi:prevent-host-death family protein